jgi:hypothetical protein
MHALFGPGHLVDEDLGVGTHGGEEVLDIWLAEALGQSWRTVRRY